MRYLIIPALLLALFAGWTAYWFTAAGRMEDAILAWIAQQRAAGVTIDYGKLNVRGFPFRIRVDVTVPHIALGQAAEQPSWRSVSFSAICHPWNFRHVIVELAGEHELSALLDGEERHWKVTTPEALASYEVGEDGVPHRLSVDMHQVTMDEDGHRLGSAVRAQIHARPGQHPGDDADIAIILEGVGIEQPLPEALGQTVSQARLQLTLTGPLSKGEPLPVVTAWRDGGGTIEVGKLQWQQNGLSIEGEGTLALDDEMRPIGALTARVQKHERLIDAALETGQMTPGAALAAKAGLGLLAAGNKGVLAVPVTLQDGKLFLGPAAIASLSPIFPVP